MRSGGRRVAPGESPACADPRIAVCDVRSPPQPAAFLDRGGSSTGEARGQVCKEMVLEGSDCHLLPSKAILLGPGLMSRIKEVTRPVQLFGIARLGWSLILQMLGDVAANPVRRLTLLFQLVEELLQLLNKTPRVGVD